MDVLKESLFEAEKKHFKEALEKAKEAGRRERAIVKYREQHAMVDSMNLDLTFTVLFNLAQQVTRLASLCQVIKIAFQILIEVRADKVGVKNAFRTTLFIHKFHMFST